MSGPRHRHRRNCWLRLRFHRWRPTWLNGEPVADEEPTLKLMRGESDVTAAYGCVECGALMG